MSALTPEQEQRVDSGIRAWEDNGGPILNHLVPVVAALIAEAVDQARAEERERIATTPVEVGRMDAYYYSFERTGVPMIDAILSAVAQAGKSFHHTEVWADDQYKSPSCEARIQAAADLAARIARTQP